jgi:hypothetical protein
MRKILTVDGFVYNSQERMTECSNTLIWNSNLFDEIHVMCENDLFKNFYQSLIKDKDIKNIKVHLTNKERPTCKDQIDFCNSVADDQDFKFFANLDTTFSEDLSKLKNYNFDQTFITFSNRAMRNHNNTYLPMDGDPLDVFNKTGYLNMDPTLWNNHSKEGGVWQVAHCGWAWIDKKQIPEYNAMLGNPGGENVLLRQVRAAGYKVRSAAVICRTFHNHRSDVRTDRHYNRIGGADGAGFISLDECLV